MEISKDPETGQVGNISITITIFITSTILQVVTISRVLLPALKREQHGEELSCEVKSVKRAFGNFVEIIVFPLKVVHPGADFPLWVKAMLNIGCKSTKDLFPLKSPPLTMFF